MFPHIVQQLFHGRWHKGGYKRKVTKNFRGLPTIRYKKSALSFLPFPSSVSHLQGYIYKPMIINHLHNALQKFNFCRAFS